ncbi:Uncharacterised protein [Mycobacterium tuberculosis]|nr:Uncharacterised protein [Mycobacterium tuberculosis]
MDERDYRGRRTQNPERGRKLNNTFFERGAVESVVRPKTPRGDGNSKSSTTSAAAACSRSRQTQNPERGRKRFERELVHSPPFRSSDPKPREGTETRKRSTSLTILFSRRQTQNPERGRKRISPATPQPRYCSMSSDPKPREGTETLMVGHGRARLSGSSDPKPREGTETGRRIAPGAGGAAVVRPKTPRGDGNATMASKSAWVTDPGRQTQNPERGRKRTADDSYVRVTSSQSSDPKPREGTET